MQEVIDSRQIKSSKLTSPWLVNALDQKGNAVPEPRQPIAKPAQERMKKVNKNVDNLGSDLTILTGFPLCSR